MYRNEKTIAAPP